MEEYLKNAPLALIKYYELKYSEENPSLRKYRVYLERLVKGTHASKIELDRAWKILSKFIKTEQDASMLWSHISHAIYQSKKRNVWRSEKRDYFHEISSDAISLKQKLEETELDKWLFEFFPDEDMTFNGVPNWQDLSSDERQETAFNIMHHWPYLIDVLQELSERSNKLSNEAMTEKRVTERNRSESFDGFEDLIFIRYLYDYLKYISGKGQAAPVAYITNALFDREYSNRDIEQKCNSNLPPRLKG